ncbi:hypothetical protein Hdeb2414_s0301g00861121 [Helianthus debilis subsp. tardiflorus]
MFIVSIYMLHDKQGPDIDLVRCGLLPPWLASSFWEWKRNLLYMPLSCELTSTI